MDKKARWALTDAHSETYTQSPHACTERYLHTTRMWANGQRDGRPAEYRWHPLFNAAEFGWRLLL